MGLGTLAKGPVAIALPGGAIFIWLIWGKKAREIFSSKIFGCFVTMLAIAVPCYWLVHKATNGEWTKGFFLQHTLGRFFKPMEGHGIIYNCAGYCSSWYAYCFGFYWSFIAEF